MKIGIDASRYQDHQKTGVEIYSKYIIDELLKIAKKDKNQKITLYTSDPNKNLTPRLQKSIKTKYLYSLRLWTLFRLSLEMITDKPDTLFIPSHVLPLIRPKKTIITIHDVAFKYFPKAYSFSQKIYLNWSTKKAVKTATKIIVPSQTTKSDLIKFYKCKSEKIVIIPHGFTPTKQEANNKIISTNIPTPYILFIGRIETKKNISRLIQAFSNFRTKHPEYHLVLAGKPGIGYETILNNLRTNQKSDQALKNHIHLLGYVSDQEKSSLYYKASLFAFPSLYEGFGIPLLESFYHKVPVLTSNISTLKEVGGDAALYVNPKSSKEIEEGLITIVEDQNLRKEMVKKGKEILNKFSWQKAGKKTWETIVS